MKITDSAVREIYSLSKKVYEGDMSKSAALKVVESKKYMSQGSASIYIQNFKCLLRGVAYKRAMNKFSTELFLLNIKEDFGFEKFKISLSSAQAHLDYYHTLGKGKQVGISNIVEKLASSFNIESTVNFYPDEITEVNPRVEGSTKKVTINSYERSSAARSACIAKHGLSCKVFNIDFESLYGDIGVGFIHVHHIVDIASIGCEYMVNPEKDLVPVCPNCHAMLHRTTPAMSVNQLKEKIASNKEN